MDPDAARNQEIHDKIVSRGLAAEEAVDLFGELLDREIASVERRVEMLIEKGELTPDRAVQSWLAFDTLTGLKKSLISTQDQGTRAKVRRDRAAFTATS